MTPAPQYPGTSGEKAIAIMLNPCNHCRIVDACQEAYDDNENPPCKGRPIPQAQTPSLMEIQKINKALQKLYPDDFALQINEKQLQELSKEHDAAIRKEAYEQGAREEREKVLKEIKKEVSKLAGSGECKTGWEPVDGASCDDPSTCSICVISWAIESLRGTGGD